MAYIKFEGVDGEATDRDHGNWSELLSFSQSINASTGDGATRRRGDVVLEDVVVRKTLDRASPKLAGAIAQGKVFPKVEIHLTASYTDVGRVTYYAYERKNVQVVSYRVGSSSPSDGAMESFSLNFEEIKVTYTENDSAGKTKGNTAYTWKVEEGAS